jgi:hypothetical protein
LFIDLHTVLMNSKDGEEGRKDNSKKRLKNRLK